MLYAFVADYNPNTSEAQRDAALVRRATWKPHAGATIKSEHWSFGNSPLIYTVFEADDPKALWQMLADWSDVLDVRIFPVITAEFGLANGQEIFSKRAR